MRRTGKVLLGVILLSVMMLGMVCTARADVSTLDSNSTSWDTDSTIDSDLTIDGNVTVNNDITLTVPEGKTLAVNGSIDASGKTLTVEGEGTLIVYGTNGRNGTEDDSNGGDGGTGFTGDLIVYDATVNVIGGKGGDSGKSGSGGNNNGGYGGTGIDGTLTVYSGSTTVSAGNAGTGYLSNDHGGEGGIGINGDLIVNGGSATVNAGIGGYAGLCGRGGIGIVGNVIVNGGLATVTGGDGPFVQNAIRCNGGDGIDGNLTVNSGTAIVSGGNGDHVVYENGDAVTGTILGPVAKQSDNNIDWQVFTHGSSDMQYVRVEGLMEYPLCIGGVQVTNLNAENVLTDHTVKYDATSHTLKLKNATITSGYTDTEEHTYGIYYTGSDELNIVLDGNSEVSDLDYGVFSDDRDADLTVSGDGSITISARLIAIKAAGNLEISGGTVTAISTNNDISAYAIDVFGAPHEDTLTITDGTLTASGVIQAIRGRVKNSIAGAGWRWSTYEGGEIKEEIPAVTGDNTNNLMAIGYTKVQFPESPAATVTKVPTAKTLTYTGEAQELISAGEATGGQMYYALSADATAPDAWRYSTSIPTETDAGIYFIWYMAKGDLNHSDSTPTRVTSIIYPAQEAENDAASEPVKGKACIVTIKKHLAVSNSTALLKKVKDTKTKLINELMFRVPMLQKLDAQSAFNLRTIGTNCVFNGTNISNDIFTATRKAWTNFACCGNQSTDQIE